jgi:predicted nucleic-acid-binding protein
MLGLDTNVLVRYLVRDDAQQSRKVEQAIARAVGKGESLFIGLPVLMETEWVLRSRYRLKKAEIAAAISGLLDSGEILFEDESSLEEALLVWKDTSADFADCLIGIHNRRMGCRATLSFDAAALNLTTFVSP